MEDLSNRWKSLSLSEKEGSGLALKSDQATTEVSLVARFLTKRPLNLDAIAQTFNPLWRTKTGFRMKFIGDHLILFSFDSEEDVNRILAAAPWSFDKHIMVVSRYENTTVVSSKDMTTVPFWVQVHDIPLRFRNREVAEQICEAMGTVVKPENPNDSDGGSFIRVRVALNITLPLCRGRLLTLENDEAHWVSFRFERLPNVCYWCGCLTHPDKDCEKWIESEGTLKKEDQHFGPWLRAAPFTASRKGFLSVPGFYAHKKAGKANPNQTGAQPHDRNTPSAMTCEPPQNLPPKLIEENANHAPDKSEDVTTQNLNFSETSFLVPPLQPTQPTSFEQVIAEIDRDIYCFDRVEQAASHGFLATEKSDQCQYDGIALAAHLTNYGDIKKGEGKRHGGSTEVLERSNQVPLSGNAQIKKGEGGLGTGPGKENIVGLNAVGPKLNTNISPGAGLDAKRPRSPLKDLTNETGPLKTQQSSLGSKWTRLVRPTNEPKLKEATVDKLRERPATDPSDSHAKKRRAVSINEVDQIPSVVAVSQPRRQP